MSHHHTPNLIEPSPVLLERLNKASTVYDTNAKQPLRQTRRLAAVTLSAQISSTRDHRTAYKFTAQGGAQAEAEGYLVLRRKDLEALSVSFQRGDKITSMAGNAVEYYVVGLQRAGHHHGQHQLEFWFYSDRRPAKGQG